MGYVHCRFSSRQHTTLQQRDHHDNSPRHGPQSMGITAVCLHRQLAWRRHLLLYRTPHHSREGTAALPYQATKHGTRSQAGAPLGSLDGTSLLASHPWRSNTCHIRHHALPSPSHQHHDANWPHPTLCRYIILGNGYK